MSWWQTRRQGDQHPVQQGHSANSNHHRGQHPTQNAYYNPNQATGHHAPVPTGMPAAVPYPSHLGHHATQAGYDHHGLAPTVPAQYHDHYGGMATPATQHHGNHGGATAPAAQHHRSHGGAPAQYYGHDQHAQTPAPTTTPPVAVGPHGQALRIHFTKEAEKQIEDLNKTDPRFRGDAEGMHKKWVKDYAAERHPNATRANVRKAAHAGGTNERELEHTTVSFKGPGEDGHGRHIYARFPDANESTSRMAPSDARSGAQYDGSAQGMGYSYGTRRA